MTAGRATRMEEGAVVIIGAGQAGLNCALALRELGHQGPVLVLSDEADWPYDRPPLSKSVGADAPAGVPIVSEPILADKAIELWRGQQVIAIDRARKQVRTGDGATVAYGTLVLAMGGAPKTLSSLPVDGRRVFAMRTLADSRALSAATAQHRRFLVVGGGWLGLELAAAVAESGKPVVIVETAPRLCARSLPAEVSAHLHHIHEERGNTVLTGIQPGFSVDTDGIRISGHGRPGEKFDAAIVAVGMWPRVELAAAAGLAVDDGIVTDASGRTGDPHVFAIGDVARNTGPGESRGLRLESWRSAVQQGRRAARAIRGLPAEPIEAPWFWSEQFGQMIQVAGLPDPGLDLVSHDPGPAPLWYYGRGGDVRVMIGFNRPKEVRRHARTLAARMNEFVASAEAAAR